MLAQRCHGSKPWPRAHIFKHVIEIAIFAFRSKDKFAKRKNEYLLRKHGRMHTHNMSIRIAELQRVIHTRTRFTSTSMSTGQYTYRHNTKSEWGIMKGDSERETDRQTEHASKDLHKKEILIPLMNFEQSESPFCMVRFHTRLHSFVHCRSSPRGRSSDNVKCGNEDNMQLNSTDSSIFIWPFFNTAAMGKRTQTAIDN